MTRPLLISNDPLVLDDLQRLAATAGVEVDVAADVAAARGCWTSASLVIIGPDLLERCAASRLARRARVVVLGWDLDAAAIWQRAVDVGAEKVVFLPDAEPWLVRALTEAVEASDGAGVVVATVGGRGGAGATTLSAALAQAGARAALRTLLVDGDPLGGGVDLVLGAEGLTGLRWPDLTQTRGRLPATALAAALPQVDGIAVLSWDRGDVSPLPVEAVEAVLDAGRRAFDLVVVDLPRTLDEVAREVLAAATCGLLVVPAEVRATAAAARVAARAGLLCRDLRLVVRGPSPADVSAAHVQQAPGLPLVGTLKPEPHLDEHLEEGRPPGRRPRWPLGAFSDALLRELLGDEQVRRAA
ncbi:MAG: septum site-determining protein Ssd [Mycobacteriales bacterium]